MPSTDFVDFRPPAVNAEWLNEVNDYVFDGSLTSPSGGKKDAMNVLIQSMGYDAFVDYAAGLAMGTTTQTVLYQGVVYAPNLADLPFTTSGAFEAAKFHPATLVDETGGAHIGLDDKAAGVNYTTVQAYRDFLASSGGAKGVGFIQTGAGATASELETQTRLIQRTPQQFYETADGTNWKTAIDKVIAASGAAEQVAFTRLPDDADSPNYTIQDTIEIFDKPRCQIDFGGQLIDATGFSALAVPAVAVDFKGISQGVVGDLFVIGHATKTSTCIRFGADGDSSSIHMKVGKLHASGGAIGILIGDPNGYQVSDSQFEDLYGADAGIGVYLTGVNTLAMLYGRVSAYNNTTYGVLFDQGGGTITSLQVADSGSDLFFGSPAGTDHNKLSRWDILGGYCEQGAAGEVFIDSAACSDANPFIDQISISGFRCTPFSSTNVTDFIQWRLNGDLVLQTSSFITGQQEPVIVIDHNTSYRAPKVILNNCTNDCQPDSAPQLCLGYVLSDNSQAVEFNDLRVNNGISYWNNEGSADGGVIASGIDMRKGKAFGAALLEVGNLAGAWGLEDISAGSCKNLVAGGAALGLSAAMERRDFWQDDGLTGFGRAGTTAKTLSNSTFTAAAAYTFFVILRSFAGADVVDATMLGGALGIRIGIGTGFAQMRVGAVSVTATPTNGLDAHAVIGRYTSGSRIEIDAVNLRTGEILNAANTTTIPAYGALTWANGISLANTSCMRGFPAVWTRVLTDIEVSSLLQQATLLTTTWRA